MYTSLCIARVFDEHRSCQKLINDITNIKAKSKRYHWIQKIPVLKRLFIQNFCKRSRCMGGSRGGGAPGARPPPPPKIEKKMIFWRKIVSFHTKYPKNFRAPLRSAQFF